MKNSHRIWAVTGLVLMAASILCMLIGAFVGESKALMLNISLICLAGSGAILLLLGLKRRRGQQDAGADAPDGKDE